jgi:hypothetical protein
MHGDRPVGVELHLEIDLLWRSPGDVEPYLAHRLHDLGPDRIVRVGSGRLRPQIGRGELLEERLRHLRPAGVVRTDEEHVAHISS